MSRASRIDGRCRAHGDFVESGIELPVVFITGHGDVPMSVRAMKAGAVDFLIKPFRDPGLLDAVHAAIARHRGQRQHLTGVATWKSATER